MAENAGHLVVLESATDGVTFTEIDGGSSLGRGAGRTVLDVTTFKDTSGHKLKIVGLKEESMDVGGHVMFMPTTFTLDTGIKNIIQRARDGGTLTLRAKLEGAAGTYRSSSGLVSEWSLSAEADGVVEWSAKVQFSGVAWA